MGERPRGSKKHNNQLLSDFKKYLKNKSLKPATIRKHVGNVEFYANNYLFRYDITPVEDGALKIGGFLGDYFIRKTTWSSPNAIKENISSFKKFYTFLNEINMLANENLNEMKQLIKEEKEDWIESARAYDYYLDEW